MKALLCAAAAIALSLPAAAALAQTRVTTVTREESSSYQRSGPTEVRRDRPVRHYRRHRRPVHHAVVVKQVERETPRGVVTTTTTVRR